MRKKRNKSKLYLEISPSSNNYYKIILFYRLKRSVNITFYRKLTFKLIKGIEDSKERGIIHSSYTYSKTKNKTKSARS